MDNRDLVNIVKYWQPRLKLKDWEISIKFATDSEIESILNTNFARTRRCNMSKKAHCMIKPFDKISKDSLGCKDIEVTVVHELLHLLIAPIDTYAENTPANEMIEHIVETLALALVSAKRDEIVK